MKALKKLKQPELVGRSQDTAEEFICGFYSQKNL